MSDTRKTELERELSDCVLSSSWIFCVAGASI